MRLVKDGIKDLHVFLLVLVVMLAGCGRKTAEIIKDPVTEDQSVLTETADNKKPEESSMYGGFEQVGSIGQSIPRNDTQTAAKAGDIVLYSGNQIVVFYGSNSWAYTRLGRITDKTEQELTEMLGNRNVVLRFETGLNR